MVVWGFLVVFAGFFSFCLFLSFKPSWDSPTSYSPVSRRSFSRILLFICERLFLFLKRRPQAALFGRGGGGGSQKTKERERASAKRARRRRKSKQAPRSGGGSVRGQRRSAPVSFSPSSSTSLRGEPLGPPLSSLVRYPLSSVPASCVYPV